MLRLSSLLAISVSLALPVQAKEFTWAVTTDPQTMDPHAVNSAPVLGFLNNVYEGLVRRGKDMGVEPALATSWEPIGDGEGWRFNLRQGVTFKMLSGCALSWAWIGRFPCNITDFSKARCRAISG